MNKFRIQGLLWSRNNVSEKTSVRFVRLCEFNICKKNRDYLPDRSTRVAQNAQKITDLTLANMHIDHYEYA